MPTFFGAVEFLTIVPMPGPGVPPGRAAMFFPLVGAALGLIGAVILIAAAAVRFARVPQKLGGPRWPCAGS